MHKAPTREDVLSVFVGIRPLVKVGDGGNTAALSRDHTIHIDESGLLNITGGKWTTYRHMAEDCVNHAAVLGKLADKDCVTQRLNIHGFHTQASKFGRLSVYGSDAPGIQALMHSDPALTKQLHPQLPYVAAEVIWAARNEMVQTIEDVLARRTRALFLNSKAALECAPLVAKLLSQELGRDSHWIEQQLVDFEQVAKQFTLGGVVK
jgi:glycerol-3-phosphate dehydrogenase